VIVAVDPEKLAEAAYAEVLATTPRTAERRAAVCLYIAATVPPAKSVQAVINAIGTFNTDAVQAAALGLLYRIASEGTGT
jgi:hypothetical protein